LSDKLKNNIPIRLRIIAFNSLYNIFGYGIPLLFALIFIPTILNKLGTDKFGVLNLAWIVIGYFGFFDLGIGRALTKIVSEKIGKNQLTEITSFFWTSLFIMFLFSSFITVCLYFFSEKLVFSFFKIPAEIQQETLRAFYLLILSIPIVTTTAGIRGLLEAYQRFDIINVIRIILGVSSFLIPVLVLIFTSDLFWIILFLVLVRIVIWFMYLISAFRVNKDLLQSISLKFNLIKPIFRLSSWMTVSNITVPVIVYIDRLLIASVISSAAVAYYATPYEITTKLLIIPSALTSVLFPAFAANYFKDKMATIKLSDKAIKYVGLILSPIIALIIIFSFELLQIWIGTEFAQQSYLILELLSFGILFNSIAYIPFSFIEGIGRPDVTAKLQLIELPVYVALMWLAIKISGIYGAALVYMLRMILDCFLMIYFSKKIVNVKFNLDKKFSYLIFIPIVIAAISFVQLFILKIFLFLILMILFAFISWKYFLDEEDVLIIKTKIRPLINKV
jgi:O-antigen/teichoic acid export membrane protein